ncbi:MAG: hypothetical protein AAFX87_01780 [Bacteroidota bacterium]
MKSIMQEIMANKMKYYLILIFTLYGGVLSAQTIISNGTACPGSTVTYEAYFADHCEDAWPEGPGWTVNPPTAYESWTQLSETQISVTWSSTFSGVADIAYQYNVINSIDESNPICGSLNTITTTVAASDVPPIQISVSDLTPCLNSTIVLEANNVTNNIEWFDGNTLLGIANPINITVTGDMNITVTGNVAHCSGFSASTGTISLTASAAPSMSIADETYQFCLPQEVFIAPNKPEGISSFVWKDQQSTTVFEQDVLDLGRLPVGAYLYHLYGRDANGCESTDFAHIDIQVLARCNASLNYISATAYDEYGNPIAGSRTYYDHTGQLLQNQARGYSDHTVIINQPVYDRLNRSVINTLSAPATGTAYNYRGDFVLDNTGLSYGYLNFDDPLNPQKFLNPDLINNLSILGDYYSGINTTEDFVPSSIYPYSRTEFYDDGTGEVKRSAGVGEELRLGSGHEVYSKSFGVSTELDAYIDIRNKILGLTAGPNTLSEEAIQTVSIDQDDNMTVAFTDRSENVLMTARKGDWLYPSSRFTLPEGSGFFYVLDTDENIQISESEDVQNVKTGFTWFSLQNGTLAPGFWRIESSHPDLTISTSYGFGDISFNFYDDAGRLVVAIAPNGVEQILKSPNGIDDFDLANLPFATYYHYNHQGWLLSMREPDAGVTEYLYRKDGSIRFSQNAQQKVEGRFSYTDYDNLGRPIESGEYKGAMTFPGNLTGQLEDTGSKNWHLTDENKDWVRTHYDQPAEDFNADTGMQDLYQQDFIMGAVSWTENENIKTWYSYDEQGRVTWMMQKPTAVPIIFVVEYEYDFLGNVLQVAYKSYDSDQNLRDQFYHHYQYDADKRLSQAWTSEDGNIDKAVPQAKYIYYLHGPLKRIELAGDLQGIDFVYNIQGWLKRINHPDSSLDPGNDGEGNGFKKDAFGMILNYYEHNMNGLFQVSTLDNRPNPLDFHGLTEDGTQPMRIASMFDVFRPTIKSESGSVLKQYSAEQPIYSEQLKSLINQRSSDQ